MCGIAASVTTSGRALPLNLSLLRHRGPDGEGEWFSPDGRVWMGHTRLAIIDLSPTGSQPMHDRENGNVIIFNGEIYNHLQLREQMRDANVKWIGTSDTETLLAGYRLWGEGLLNRLKGMFAFVLYDKSLNRLFVARGPFGIKPLYYETSGAAVRISSEIRPLIAGSSRTISRNGISSYLEWGSCPEGEFLFPEIKMLAAGHSMTISADASIEVRRFWPKARYAAVSTDRAPSEVRRLLEKSIQEHLVADVPVAAFLSGGIDSSVITALAARAMGTTRLKTFCVGFPHRAYDETAVAAEVARCYNTEHYRIEVGDDEAIELVQEAVRKMDAPSVDAINTFIVSQKVADLGIKVALSGLGADELFGGYPSFRDVPRLRLLAILPRVIRRLGCRFGKLGARLADMPDGDVTSIAIWRRRLWSDQMLHEAGLPIVPLMTDPPPELRDDFARICWAELAVYMRQMLLRDSDQMSMAASIELRVPFLDLELVEYLLSLPARAKTRYAGAKGLLVESCRDLLPERVYNRPKMGFVLPMDFWIRGPLAGFSQAGLGEVERRALLAPGTVERLRKQFEARQIHWTRFWSLVVLGHYLKKLGTIAALDETTIGSAA